MSTQPLLQRTAQKRIALPVRVEPKVFFANERSMDRIMHTLANQIINKSLTPSFLFIASFLVMDALYSRAWRPVCRLVELWR